MSRCEHTRLNFDSANWGEGSYKQPSAKQIRHALQLTLPTAKKRKTANKSATDGQRPALNLPSKHTFPAPLVEEDDELYHDPDDPPQSLQDWFGMGTRNEVTRRRRTVYVVPPPMIAEEVDCLADWIIPQTPPLPGKRKAAGPSVSESSTDRDERVPVPHVEDVAEYLQAFYHGLPVKVLKNPLLRFARWDDGPQPKTRQKRPEHVALEIGKEGIRIRCRPSPDKTFEGQLNLNDLLDAAISVLPADAYALLMLVDHDMYEDEEDDFCCGRAYGGSRVAVVSSARYHPTLDTRQHVDREHSWPASHCRAPSVESVHRRSKFAAHEMTASEVYPGSALAAGIDASNPLSPPSSAAGLSTLWLGRICKTASHELGHCFGIAHCSYYACIMQGTANIAEDSRQPPYLCPVDLAKVLKATGAKESERYGAMLAFCERRADDRMFAAFAAWIRVRLLQGDIL